MKPTRANSVPKDPTIDIGETWALINHKLAHNSPRVWLTCALSSPYCIRMRGGGFACLLFTAGCGLPLLPAVPLAPEIDPADRTAQVITDSYICWVWSAYPAEGTVAGIHDLDHTYGDWSPTARRGRVETLRYYLAEIDSALGGRLTKSRRFDLEALRMDIELRLLRGPSPNWVAMGLLALLGSPNVSDEDRGRWLAGRLHEIPSIPVHRGEPEMLLSAIAAAEAWFRSCDDSDLRTAGLRAANAARTSVAMEPVPPPLGEDRLRAMISILLCGVSDGRIDLKAIAAKARKRIGALTPRVNSSAPPPRLAVHLEDNPWGIPGMLIGPEPFAEGKARARFRPTGSPWEEATELYPGRLTYRTYLRERASPAAKLARNAMLEQGHVLLATRAVGDVQSEVVATCRLLAAIEYHSGSVNAVGAARILRDGIALGEEDARREVSALAADPEAATGPLGAWYLEPLLARANWGAVISAGQAPLEALWRVVTGSPRPGSPCAGPAWGNY